MIGSISSDDLEMIDELRKNQKTKKGDNEKRQRE